MNILFSDSAEDYSQSDQKQVLEKIHRYAWIALRNGGWEALEHIKEQTEEMILYAVGIIGTALKHAKIQTPEIVHTAVSNARWDSTVLRFVQPEYRVFDTYRLAVIANGNALEFVPEEAQTPELCLLAIQQNTGAIRYVHNQTEDLCMRALNLNTWPYIRNPTDAVKLAYAKLGGWVKDNPTPEMVVIMQEWKRRAKESEEYWNSKGGFTN